ncbi:MAG TPA: diguanylate cyclase [Gaiellales bacterium]|nr:diguanylate cyclase [Gaiellales bacterium]
MRFRHKLSIVLVGLAIVPLVAAGLIVQALLAGDEVRSVDSKLSAGAAGAAAAYRAQLEVAETLAVQMAGRPDVARAFARRDGSGIDLSAVPSGYSVALADDRGTFAGSVPEGTVWSTTARLSPETHDRRVIVSLPLNTDTLLRVQSQSPVAEGVGLALVVGGRSIASIGGPAGPATGLRSGQPADARIGTTDVRAQAVEVQGPGRPAQLVADYPSSRIADRIDAVRLKLLIPLAVLAGIVAACALLAADRISRALVELSQRALALVRSESPLPRGGGDELEELNVALDTMSGQLSDRMSELESERARLKATLARYGETLAATHDLRALLGAVLDTAVQATKARGGRLLLYDVERGEATEQVRLGTARGSRTDLPMVVPAGLGLEGEALLAQQPRWSAAPRPLVAVPIVREQNLLGVVTVVDPAEGSFGPDDVETLAGLAVQAGVAIENARLHRAVEQQAITDELTGLANRRQFYEVLGREFERAHRFGTPLSLILLDIDDFKRINDTHPMKHLAGDAVLGAVAAAIASHIRDIDLAARYGGEEFAVLLPQTDREGAVNLAERLRVAIADQQVSFGEGDRIAVTASFGVASGPFDDQTQLDLIATADNALYASKRAGKNRVS